MAAKFFKSIFGCGNDSSKDEFTEAHLGETSNFYYDEKRKRWVTRGEEPKDNEEEDGENPGDSETTEAAPPPPPPAASAWTTRSETNRRTLTSGDLYTHIPGIGITSSRDHEASGESKDTVGGESSASPVATLAQVPPAPKSHFTPRPETGREDSALDQQLYNDLLACNLKPVEGGEDADTKRVQDHQFTDTRVQGGALDSSSGSGRASKQREDATEQDPLKSSETSGGASEEANFQYKTSV